MVKANRHRKNSKLSLAGCLRVSTDENPELEEVGVSGWNCYCVSRSEQGINLS